MKIYSNGSMIEVGGGGVTMEQVNAAIDAKLDAYTPLEVYSTEETRIGTWIDGKPLYRKCYQATSPGSVNNPLPIVTIEESMNVIFAYGTLIDANDVTITLSYPFPTSSATIYAKSGNVYMYVTYAKGTNRPCTIVLEYTKTTDQAAIETQSLLASKSDNVLSVNSIPIQTMATTASAEIKNEEG